MTSTTNLFHPSSNRAALAPCGVVVAGLMALYLPSFIDLFKGAWATEKNAHGPIVMAVAFAYLTFRLRQVSAQGLLERRPQPLPGGLMLVFGLLCYVLGRSQSVLVLEVGSMVPVLSGIMVAGFGVRTWSRMWFAFFFMFFMIPLPTSVVDVVTLPMKIAVSYAAEHLLYWTGYPVARSGVMLSIGPYQLLVADACAGLNSLFTLEAMGLLYMNLVRHQSAVRNAVLATLIVPISFTANTIRIMCLALITYHLGDGAGQGFLHGFSGLVLFLSALVLIACIDGLLTRLVGTPRSDPAARPASRAATAGRWQHMAVFGGRASAAMMIAMVSSLALAQVLTPTLQSNDAGAPLADSVPLQFGEWKALPNAPMQAELSTAGDGGKSQEQPYDDVLMRTYVNNAGEQVMLAIAYARAQRQDVKLHFPDVCYPAQGYKVLELTPASLSMTGNDTALPGKHMLASGNGRLEAVTYWARTGDAYPQGGLAMRMKIFRDGLQGKVTDGMLVRSSMLVHSSAGAANAYAVQERFLKQLVSASNMHGKALIARTTEVKS
jgi:exosortase B